MWYDDWIAFDYYDGEPIFKLGKYKTFYLLPDKNGKTDIANLKTVLRMRHRGIKGHKELLISGGTLKVDLLSSVQSLSDLSNILEGTKFQEYIIPYIKEEIPDLNSCVHALDEFVANRSKRFSYLYPLSVLPVLDFLLKKEREVRNLRAIVRGKQTGLSIEKIEELVVV